MLRNFFAREELVGRNTEGQTLVEYALIIALVAVMIVGSLMLMSDPVNGIYGNILTALDLP